MGLLENRFSGKEQPALFYYGWVVVFVSFLCHMFIFAVPTLMLPQLYGPMIDQFGWTRSDVTLIASAKFASGAITAFFTGQFIQRFGTGVTTVVAALITGLGMISFLFITEIWHLIAIGAVLGIGSLSLVINIKVLVSRWFQGRLGLALGLALLGTAGVGPSLTFVLEPLINEYGWRMSVAFLSGGIWFIALPIFLFFARENPKDLGLKTEGMSDAQSSNIKDLPKHFSDFAATVKKQTFIAMSIGVFLIGFVDQGLLQHTVEFLDKDAGLGRDMARYGFSLLMTISLAGKIGFGWLFDRLAFKGVIICYISIGVGVLLAFPVGGLETLIAFCVARGISHGGTIVDVPYLCRQAFGPAILARTIGTMTMVLSAGFALGPYVIGLMYDQTGNYDNTFYLCIILALIAAASLYWVKPEYKDWLARQST
jgi:MFS family permease